MTEPQPECRRLAAELRSLRTRARLSMAGLAAASTHSKSSWERYLNGKALPPWAAVQELCAIAEEPEAPLRALWELAEAAWSGRGAIAAPARPAADPRPDAQPDPVPDAEPEPGPDPDPEPDPQPGAAAAAPVPPPATTPPLPARAERRLHYGVAVLAGVALACAALTAGSVYAWRGISDHRQQASATPAASATGRLGCRDLGCDGDSPETTNCGGSPQTLGEFQTSGGGGLEIRYTPQCGAVWTRVWHTQVGDEVSITSPGAPTETSRVPDSYTAEGFFFSPMAAATGKGSLLRGCLAPPGNGRAQCFTVRLP